MIIDCTECGNNLSDKAMICPHCGVIVNDNIALIPSSKRRLKLPNGFGQISRINNRNLRNPYRVMVTVGKTKKGRPIVKPLKPVAYFPTYNAAYTALVKYNENPYDLSINITVSELYEEWYKSYTDKQNQSQSSKNSIVSVWKYCSELYDFPARELRSRHIRQLIDNASITVNKVKKPATPYTKTRIKSLFNMMLDYAVEYEIIDKNYARNVRLNSSIYMQLEEQHKDHIPFADKEIKKLWDNVDTVPYVDVVLVQCYSGWRPSELGLIKLSNVDLKKGLIKGGMKTDAGKDRIVPIHPKVLPLVENLYNEANELGSDYLINCLDGLVERSGYAMTYARYKARFIRIVQMLELNPAHLPHDGRKHFVTMAKRYHVDEYAIKYIVGHAITDITEKVYTKRETSWLKREIRKIK